MKRIDYRVWIMEQIEEGMLTAQAVAEMLVRWGTSDDVRDMLVANEISTPHHDFNSEE